MSEGRMISAKIFKDDFVGNLNFFERLVWLGLIIACADDQGRCLDNAKLIDAEIFPYDDVSKEKINLVLDNFVQAGKIIRYEANHQKLIQIVNWWKNQKPSWAGKSIYTAPPDWTDRVRCHGKGNVITTLNWTSDGGLYSTLPSALHSREGEGEGEGEVKDEVKDEDESREASPPQQPSTALSPVSIAAAVISFNNSGSERKAYQLYQYVTGQMSIPSLTQTQALTDLQTIFDHYGKNFDRAVEEGKEIFAAWCNTTGKNGRNYSPTNTAWLGKWLEKIAPVPESIPNTAASIAERIRRDALAASKAR
jgi:hypothetical protein